MGVFGKNVLQEKVLHKVETTLLWFWFGSFGDLLTFSKDSAICVKENALSSSLMVVSVGCHILY